MADLEKNEMQSRSICIWKPRNPEDDHEDLSLPDFILSLKNVYPHGTVPVTGNDDIVPLQIPNTYELPKPEMLELVLRNAGLEGIFLQPNFESWQYVCTCPDEIYELKVQGVLVGAPLAQYTCDYCRPCSLFSNGVTNYYYCDVCMKDMCRLCFAERSADDAVKTGAQHYESRRPALQKCFTEHPQHLKKRCYPIQFACDGCLSTLVDPHFWYSGEWPKETDVHDLCKKCWDLAATMDDSAVPELPLKTSNKAERAAQVRKHFQVTEHEVPRVSKDQLANMYSFFPSIADWVPILEDEDNDFVIMNCNPESSLFRRVGFLIVDEGSYTFQYVVGTLETLMAEFAKANTDDGADVDIVRFVATETYNVEV